MDSKEPNQNSIQNAIDLERQDQEQDEMDEVLKLFPQMSCQCGQDNGGRSQLREIDPQIKKQIFIGRLLIQGYTLDHTFHTKGKEVVLYVDRILSRVQLVLTWQNVEIHTNLILARELVNLAQSKIANIKFICQVYQNSPLIKNDDGQRIIPIRLDVFINNTIFHEVQCKNEDGTISQFYYYQKCNRLMLIHLLQKCKIKVNTPSLIKPRPEENFLFKQFRNRTIGLIKRNNSQNKIQWITLLKKSGNYYPCIKSQDINEANKIYYGDTSSYLQWELICKNHLLPKRNSITNLKQVGIENFIEQEQLIQIKSSNSKTSKNTHAVQQKINQMQMQKQKQRKMKNQKQQQQQTHKRNIRERRIYFEEENKYLAEHKIPPKMLIQLKTHQKKALQWMKFRQQKINYEQLFQKGNQFSRCDFQRTLSIAWEKIQLPSGELFYVEPTIGGISSKLIQGKKIKGGILADKSGLGKTMMLISLMADEKFIGTNLIVAPYMVLRQWNKQIKNYYGQKVKLLLFESLSMQDRKNLNFNQYSVIFVTYETLISQFKLFTEKQTNDNQNQIFQFQFRRVVLDEVQIISQSENNYLKGALALKRQFSWCLTRTFIQNFEKYLFSIVAFLGVQLFGSWEWYNSNVMKSQNVQEMIYILFNVLKPITLRRTKKTINKEIPEIKIFHIIVPFSQEERKKYNVIQLEALRQWKHMRKNIENFFDGLKILTKPRQFCAHPSLLLENSVRDVEFKSLEQMIKQIISTNKSIEYKDTLTNSILQQGPPKQCCICLTEINDQKATTKCGHIFHYHCMLQYLQFKKQCPFCRQFLQKQNIFRIDQIRAKQKEIQQDYNLKQFYQNNTKLNSIMRTIDQINERKQKCVIFIQFSNMISIIQLALGKKKLKYATITEDMDQITRVEQVSSFKKGDDCNFLMVSLDAGIFGLNLQCANNVIFCHPRWSGILQDQAIDRCHRLGQTRNVNVYKFFAGNSIQTKIINQHRKEKTLGNLTMMSTQNQIAQGLDELKILMEQMANERK